MHYSNIQEGDIVKYYSGVDVLFDEVVEIHYEQGRDPQVELGSGDIEYMMNLVVVAKSDDRKDGS